MVRAASGFVVAVVGSLLAFSSPANAQAGGPVVLMGIDAEDRWRGSDDGTEGGQHGPIGNYLTLVRELLARTAGPRAGGVLVLGGGKSPNDDVTTFWTRVAIDVGRPVAFAHCEEDDEDECDELESVVFDSFALIVVASDENNTPSGGLTDDENEVLADRHEDFADFVNGGGGLLGLTSDFSDDEAYGYVAGLGAFEIETDVDPPYSNILPVSGDAAQLGITDALDVCCWHDVFTQFPDFLQVLALDADVTGRPAVVGGVKVQIPDPPPPPPPAASISYMKLKLGRIAGKPVYHRFRLDCDPNADSGRFTLEVVWLDPHRSDKNHRCTAPGCRERHWARHHKCIRIPHKITMTRRFSLTSITTVSCSDNPEIRNPVDANFDTHTGVGVGTVDNRPGYVASWEFVDGGTKRGGRGMRGRDTARITIRTPSGDAVLNVSHKLTKGDQQARTRPATEQQ